MKTKSSPHRLPGYDRPTQQDFRRAIAFNCMLCHNGYPDPPPQNEGEFPGSLPEGIDCQRCHGPGRAHAEAAGLDVSAYMVAAAIAQMAADDAASAVFTPLDADNASALAEAAEISSAPLPTFEDLTAEEQHLVLRVMRSALGSDEAGVA